MNRPSIPFRVACWIVAAVLAAVPVLQPHCVRACCAHASMECCFAAPGVAEADAATIAAGAARADRALQPSAIPSAQRSALPLRAACRDAAIPSTSASPPGRRPSPAVLRI